MRVAVKKRGWKNGRGMRECALSRLKNQNTTQTNQKELKNLNMV
jgi:hypothetical protein